MDKLCTDCQEQREAQGLCTFCNKWLCFRCTDIHQHRNTTSLFISEAEKMPSHAGPNFQSKGFLFCHFHNQELLDLFCETCDMLTCKSCHFSAHKDHRLILVGKALHNQQWLFESLMAQLDDKRSVVENSAKQIEARIHGIKIAQKKTENQIKMAKMIMINELNKRASHLIEQLEKITNDLQQKTVSQLNGVIDLCSQLSHVQNFVNWATVNQRRSPLLFSKELITFQMQRLLESQLPSDIGPPVKIKFNWDASFWTKQISTLGELTTEGGSSPHTGGGASPSVLKPQPITCPAMPASLCHQPQDQSCGFPTCLQSRVCCPHCLETQASRWLLDKKQLELSPYPLSLTLPNQTTPSLQLPMPGQWVPKSPLASAPQMIHLPSQSLMQHRYFQQSLLPSSGRPLQGRAVENGLRILAPCRLEPLQPQEAELDLPLQGAEQARAGPTSDTVRQQQRRQICLQQLSTSPTAAHGQDHPALCQASELELKQQTGTSSRMSQSHVVDQTIACTTYFSLWYHTMAMMSQSLLGSFHQQVNYDVTKQTNPPSHTKTVIFHNALGTEDTKQHTEQCDIFNSLPLLSNSELNEWEALGTSLPVTSNHRISHPSSEKWIPFQGFPLLVLFTFQPQKPPLDSLGSAELSCSAGATTATFLNKFVHWTSRHPQKMGLSAVFKGSAPLRAISIAPALLKMSEPTNGLLSSTRRTPDPKRGKRTHPRDSPSEPVMPSSRSAAHLLSEHQPLGAAHSLATRHRNHGSKDCKVRFKATASQQQNNHGHCSSSGNELVTSASHATSTGYTFDLKWTHECIHCAFSSCFRTRGVMILTKTEPGHSTYEGDDAKGEHSSQNTVRVPSEISNFPLPALKLPSESRENDAPPPAGTDLDTETGARSEQDKGSCGTEYTGEDCLSLPAVDGVVEPSAGDDSDSPSPSGNLQCPEMEPDLGTEELGEACGENEAEPSAENTMENEDFCAVCLNGGDLLCCDRCPKVFHLSCHIPPLLSFPVGDWVCTLCRNLIDPEMEYDCENTRLTAEHKGTTPQYGLSVLDQRKCEKLTLFIYCSVLSAPFHEPVSPLARHYYQIIKKPMDLSVIRSKLNKRSPLHYYTPEEFVSDVFLMFRNCAKFNYPDSEVAQAGRNLEALFNAKLKEEFPDNVFPEVTDDSDTEEFDGTYKVGDNGFPWPAEGKEHFHRKRKRRHSLSWRKHHF
uniref:Tripartite motif containing 66 n=1 Tax=Lepisosteus oculatus TaxID=7918 RepID=W5M6D9_LEPOC